MILPNMKKTKIIKIFLLELLILSVSVDLYAQSDSTYRGHRIKDFYLHLNDLAERSYKGDKEIEHYMDNVREHCTEKCGVDKYDFCELEGGDSLKYTNKSIDDYLARLYKFTYNEKNPISFKLLEDSFSHTKEYTTVRISVKNDKTQKGYKCKVQFNFVGNGESAKIAGIKFQDFESFSLSSQNTVYSNKTRYPFGVNLSAGWKVSINNANGIDMGIDFSGVGGTRWIIGADFCMLFNDAYLHYPDLSGGTAATQAYESYKNKDFAIGVNAGYMLMYKPSFVLSGIMGAGVVLYDYWGVYEGAEKGESNHEKAVFLKPTVRFEVPSWWGVGVELGGYIPLKNDVPLSGFIIQLTKRF